MKWPESPFWDYSLAFYRRPGVEGACLDLQRRHGLNVNLLLLTLWLADRGIELDQATLSRAEKAVGTWHAEVIGPVRALRRRLAVQPDDAEPENPTGRWPDHVAKLRRDVLTIELDCEHLTQLALTDLAADLQPSKKAGVELAGRNLRHFKDFQTDDLDDLRTLLRQAFPAATEKQVTAALSSFAV